MEARGLESISGVEYCGSAGYLRRLELVLARELQLTHRSCAHLAESIGAEVDVRGTPVWMVQRIERFKPDIQVMMLAVGHHEGLVQRGIEIGVAGAMEAATGCVAEHASDVYRAIFRGVDYNAGLSKRRDVRAAVDRLGIARLERTDTCLIGPIEGAEGAAETGVICPILRGGDLSGLVREGSANLPTTDQSIQRPIIDRQQLVLANRQFVQSGDNHAVAHIER